MVPVAVLAYRDDQVPVAVLAYRDDHHVLLKQVHILRPALHPHVPLLSWLQAGVLLVACHCTGLLRGGVQALVEHGGEDVNCGPVLLVQEFVVEVGQVKVNDDVIEEGVMLECLVVCQTDRHTVFGAHRELTYFAVVSEHCGRPQGSDRFGRGSVCVINLYYLISITKFQHTGFSSLVPVPRTAVIIMRRLSLPLARLGCLWTGHVRVLLTSTHRTGEARGT